MQGRQHQTRVFPPCRKLHCIAMSICEARLRSKEQAKSPLPFRTTLPKVELGDEAKTALAGLEGWKQTVLGLMVDLS